jgi:hypothetical protein
MFTFDCITGKKRTMLPVFSIADQTCPDTLSNLNYT